MLTYAGSRKPLERKSTTPGKSNPAPAACTKYFEQAPRQKNNDCLSRCDRTKNFPLAGTRHGWNV